MASREQYARVYQEVYNTEMTVGLELREGDELAQINIRLRDKAWQALIDNQSDHLAAVAHVEAYIKVTYPDRAYFLEVERDDMGVQVFQPYGLPRRDLVDNIPCPAPGETGLQAWATFGTWDGPGHRKGCEKLPRNSRGCYCGGDHQ